MTLFYIQYIFVILSRRKDKTTHHRKTNTHTHISICIKSKTGHRRLESNPFLYIRSLFFFLFFFSCLLFIESILLLLLHPNPSCLLIGPKRISDSEVRPLPLARNILLCSGIMNCLALHFYIPPSSLIVFFFLFLL